MATTTNYSWTTPDDTAYVKDGASAIRSLGSAVDTTTKALNPSTTLGDVEYRSATSNTNTRLGIGTTGQVLTVSGGVPAWATPTVAFDSALNQRVTGQYTLNTVSDSITGGTRVLNTVYYSPIFLKAGTYDRILIGTGSGHTNTTVVRMGLYNASTTTGLPTTVAFDAGTVSCTAATTNYTITISQTIATGWYYLAMVAQTVGGVAQFLVTSTPPAGVNASKSSLAGATNQNYYFTETGISGAFATAGTLSNAQSATAMGLRNA